MRLFLALAALGLVAVPALELWVLVALNRRLGLGPTLGLLLLSGVVGFWLARWQGWRALQHIRTEIAAGRLPSAAVLDGVLILAAGLLLITPGLLTDGVGFALLLPPLRKLVRRGLLYWLKRRVTTTVFAPGGAEGERPAAADPGTVEGRVVSVEDAEQ